MEFYSNGRRKDLTVEKTHWTDFSEMHEKAWLLP